MAEAATTTANESGYTSSYAAISKRFSALAESYALLGMDHVFSAFSAAGRAFWNQPQIQNQRVKAISTLPADFTKDELGEFLRNPYQSEKQLRQISQVLRWTAYPYFKITKSYADMLTYRHYEMPLYKERSDAPNDSVLRDWTLVDKTVKKLSVKRTAHTIASQAMTLGKVFYTLRYSIDKVHNAVNYVFMQQLPQDWCRIIGFNNVSKYTISFDMMYFLQPGTDWRQFGNLFEPYVKDFYAVTEPTEQQQKGSKFIYAEVGGQKRKLYISNVNREGEGRPEMFAQNGRWLYYVSLPIDKVWTYEIDDGNVAVAPPLAGLFQTYSQLGDYEAAQLSLIMNPLIKIFTGEIPYFTDDGARKEDGIRLSYGTREMFEGFWNLLMSVTNTGGTAMFSAPFQNIKSHDYAESANANQISSSFNTYGMEKAGLSALIPVTDNPHQGMAQYSGMLESQFPAQIYRTFEDMVNNLIEKMRLKNVFRFVMFGSVYTDNEIRSNAMKALDKGDLSQHFVLAALDDMSVLDKLSMSNSIIDLGLLERLIPPKTSYTQSGDSATSRATGTSAEGAPTKTETEKQEDEKEKAITEEVGRN